MDTNILITSGMSASIIVLLGLIYKLWINVIGHRLISDCCGRRMSMSLDVRDVERTPPLNSVPLITIPHP